MGNARRGRTGRGRRVLVIVVGAIIVLLAGLALRTRAAVQRLGATHPPLGRFVTVDGIRLHYQRAGTGPAVLLLHGCPGRTIDWMTTVSGEPSVYEALVEDHTVIALDRPGNGWSETYRNRSTGLDEQVELIPQFLDALEIGSAVLVGHSYGGAVIASTAVRHPEVVDGLVGVAGVYYPALGPDPMERLELTPIVGSIFEWCLSPLAFDALLEQGLAAATGPNPLAPGYVSRIAPFYARPSNLHQIALEMAVLSPSLEAVAPQYANIAVPTTVIVGDADDPVLQGDARRLTEDVPGASLVVLPGIGHFTQHNRPDAVIEAVRGMTKSTRPAAAQPEAS